MNAQKSWILCCFLNFLIASFMGLIMRFSYLFPLNINYFYLLHAHSHVAMLGWAYLMVYVLIVHFFIPKNKREKLIYNRLFWCTEIAVIGMMVSFPFQGYALFSIIFSTMHILSSYVFCWLVWRDAFPFKTCNKVLLLTAILFMVFSTFGVWCLGPAISTVGKQSAFYQIAIQFFLHFQFNGWFLIAVLALFIKQFKYKIETNKFLIFLILLVAGTILTFAFPLSWYFDDMALNCTNAIGVLFQLVSFIYGYKMLKPQINKFRKNLDQMTKTVYSLAIFSLFLKIAIQSMVLVFDMAEVSHQIRNFVIGFIHLTSLGIITGFLFGILLQNKMISDQSNLFGLGIRSFIFGYSASEILLFLQGLFFYFDKGKLPGYFESIFGMSFLIVLGLFLIVISILNKKQESIT